MLRVIKASGLKVCEKKIGSMLYAIATRATGNLSRHQEMLGELVGKGGIAHASQLDCCLQYLKQLESKSGLFDLDHFNKNCGIGQTLTQEKVAQTIRQQLEGEIERLKQLRYTFNRVELMNLAKKTIPFVQGKMLNDQLNEFVLAILGPQTAEDQAARKNKKEVKNTVKDIDDLVPREMPEARNTKQSLARKEDKFGECVLTRFPPEPNGYLHIGHAKAIRFNFQIAKKHKGKCYLRFDDTNPDREGADFIEMIKENVAFLGYQPWRITHASDYFDELYGFAERLIQLGHAFVCFEGQEVQREKRRLGEPSAFRDRPADENLALFREMRAGKFKEGEACLRGRIDCRHPNTTMRDPVIYRVKDKAHPKTGDKWRVYPMYDFTHPLCDSLEGITHSLCTLEFEIRRELYYWPLNLLDLYRPTVWEYSRMNISYQLLSKRKIQALVDKGLVRGWDDPRLLTIEGMRRRGITASAIKRFCEEVSVTRRGNENVIAFEAFENIVRKDLDDHCPRAFAVTDPVSLVLTNLDKPVQVECPDFPKDKGKGTHTLTLTNQLLIERADVRLKEEDGFYGAAPNQLVGLKYFGVVRVLEVAELDGTVAVRAELVEGLKPKTYLHWLSKAECEPAQFKLYDKLFTHPNPSSLEDELAAFNPRSLVLRKGVISKHSLAHQRVQFERLGFFLRNQDKTWTRIISLTDQAYKK